MSTIVCQNLVTCFESQLTETTTTLKLKVAPPPPPPPATLDFCKKKGSDDHLPAEVKTNLEFGNWDFLPKESVEKDESFYTHPLARNSSFSRLSVKSLELCTENLGSETGTEIITQSSITNFSSSSPSFYPSNSSENSPPHKRAELEKSKQELEAADYNAEANFCRKIKNFPPPLTTMRGPSSLQVRRHREGGRLIIEAVEKPFRSSCLQAERSDGRLRLCLLTGFDSEATTTSAREEEVKNGEECGGEMAEEEEIDEPRSEDEPENEEFDGEMNLEMGVEKFQRLSRCKESGHGNRGFSNWKPPLWVATS
ncbi:hypothetical protein Pfo_016031 [Paulownia fortunei]|nr:hypothetical protein Pfo_016031 [Paulownia fortunei]